jgi:hypothetical protein
VSYLLFIDESGQDLRESPYEVLAGVCIEDKRIWPLVQEVCKIQEECFGVQRFQDYKDEAKGRKLLKRKTFKKAATHYAIPNPDRRRLAQAMFRDGTRPAPMKLAALAQAKIAYVENVLAAASRNGCAAFASIIPRSAQRPADGDFLRKDYAYLFERFSHFLHVRARRKHMGLIVFDELEKSKSHVLVGQMERYFLRTQKGRNRARYIVPEPLFVHSDLTTMVQLADLVAYIISWGLRLPGMLEPGRPELAPLVNGVRRLQYHHPTPGGYDTWGFKYIKSLEVRNG